MDKKQFKKNLDTKMGGFGGPAEDNNWEKKTSQ